MRVTSSPHRSELGADGAIAIGVFAGQQPEIDLDGALRDWLACGEGSGGELPIASLRTEGRTWIVVGLGDREAFDPERARIAAALVVGRAAELRLKALTWIAPSPAGAPVVAGLVEGTLLADYRFDRYLSNPNPSRLEELRIVAPEESRSAVAEAQAIAAAINSARDLQNAPANEMTPTALADHAATLAARHSHLTCRCEGRAGLRERGMGAFLAVAAGSSEPPALITLRYEPPRASGPRLGFVGKAVTFDSGGLGLKPKERLTRMKFDMSGGAVVLGALEAVAELALDVDLVAVIGAAENQPGNSAMRPGDIVRAASGTSIEIVDTDAEGRLILGDCLTHARAEGAERLLDVATLTKEVIAALGSAYAGLAGSDERWLREVEAAAATAAEPVWRLPLDPEYEAAVGGEIADLVNHADAGRAGALTAAAFLRHFVGGVPWAHLDICGTAYDRGRPYASRGGSGFGVRLLCELARACSARALD